MTGRNYAYYPGCTQHSSAIEYDKSMKSVCQTLGIGLQELEEWTCCGASSAHVTSKLLGYALPARNLQLAERLGLPVTTGCPACFARLKFTAHDLADPKLLGDVNMVLGKEFRNAVQVLPILAAIRPEEVAAAVKKPLTGLKVACYYGCAFVRPGNVTRFDDEENPTSMDNLIRAAGAETVDWAFKTECCGASMTVPRPEVVVRLAGRILSAARRHGADCVAVACPMCHANLDQRQGPIASEYGIETGLPILYFSQLLGLALGFSPQEMMVGKHLTDPMPLLKAKGFA